jgi:hypothetical protein
VPCLLRTGSRYTYIQIFEHIDICTYVECIHISVCLYICRYYIYTYEDMHIYLNTSLRMYIHKGALKYLLYDIGVPANGVVKADANRNAFHCLSLVHVMGDAHSKSQVFAILKGTYTYIYV